MIKFSEIKPGDIVMAEFEGEKKQGIVKNINREDKEICIETGVQEFWFTADHLYPIPLDESQLLMLGFHSQTATDGSVKYMKDSFRLVIPKAGDFSHIDMWWREDRRHVNQPFYVHDLQNHHYDMTKVELNSEASH
ncbi:MAG: hypothetical protein H7Y31_07845 [Chitinophagaceae bacterium]|nr:hypothetical protein [Chitinophagaceae bacterium]